ncbi:expressed unknown protein [Seminavis robusta]|uniref:Uncharacterized protein n=1 Tax=Seminavis robusta TaxID=568900 RepID=A0A9N8DAU5_9STRA|nr:expressed unknown protein [Seminavis robusta]|eukprot:Sro18_g012930.1 n/a (222) ;mRNA; r:101405-102178
MIGVSRCVFVVTSALLLVSVTGQQPSGDVSVGQEICTAGYVMDEFCIDFGKLLDAQEFETLNNPEEHTMHCLVDVPKCYDTPFHILSAPLPGDTMMYGPGWAVSNNTELLTLGRQIGDLEGGCTTCDGTGSLLKGFRAEVRGTVATIDPPVIDVTSVSYLEGDAQGCAELATSTSDANGSPQDASNSGGNVTSETPDSGAFAKAFSTAAAIAMLAAFVMGN